MARGIYFASIYMALLILLTTFQGSLAEFQHSKVFTGTCDQTHPCSQICVPIPPHSLRCSCFPGNVLSGNGWHCLGETIDIDSEIPTTDGLITDDEDFVDGSGSGDGEGGDGSGPPDQVADLTCDEWPCYNGGTCYIFGETPMCTCALGWEGAMCEDAVNIRYPRFYGNSFLSIPVPTSKLYQSFFISISFKPESINGRLLFASQEQDGRGDYIAVGLVQGKAVFRFDCGQGAAVITSETSVTLHKWHTLKIGRDLRKGWLQLDDQRIVRGSTPGVYSKVTLKGDLYIGGFNETEEIRDGLRVKHMFQGFKGCIESIDIANMDLDLRPHPKGSMLGGQNIGECSEGVCQHHVCTNGGSCISRSPDQAMCLCPLGTHGSVCEDVIEIHTPSFNSTHSSHIAHDTLGKKHLSFLQMEIIFKPKEPSGILIYSGTESRDGDFFSITLDNNYIGFKFDCGSGPAVLRSTQPVTLHEWHIVEVSRTAREGMLRVDNQPTVTAMAPGAFTQTSFDTSLYIGGIDDIDLLSREVAVKNSFSGDIQRVLVNENPLDLINEAIGGANVGNAHHPCQGQPCRNGGECHPEHDHYLCDCQLGFKGDSCEIEIEDDVTEPRFTGRSYVRYASNAVSDRISGERNVFTFEMRATEPNGLVLWAGHASMSKGSDFISIGLEDGFLVLKFDLGGGEAKLRSRRPINDGEWHRVGVDRLGIVGIMEIDNDIAVTNQASDEKFRQLNVNDGLYLGGMDDIVDKTLNLYSTGMTGCLRNLRISQDLVVFESEQPAGGMNIQQCS